MNPSIERATARDLPAVLELLAQCKLPRDGITEHFADFLVARDAERVVGVVGLERYGDSGLLRSLAVEPAHRGSGLGVALTHRLLDEARKSRMRRMYLLTETASAFFPRFGFQAIDRQKADDAVRRSVEFATACPQSALCMALTLTPA